MGRNFPFAKTSFHFQKAAVMLEPSEEYGIEDFVLKTDGQGADYLYMQGGGSRYPASHESVDGKMHFVTQEGATVFKFAVTNMAEVAAEIMERNHLTAAEYVGDVLQAIRS